MPTITYTDFLPIATAISAYAQERYTHAQLINSTAIVGNDASITDTGEGFVGQLRWHKATEATVNTASLTDPTAGAYTTLATELSTYIKNVKTIGVQQVNLQEMISKVDGISIVSNRLAMHRAKHESDAVLAVLQGVAASEIALGAGITDFDTMPGATTGAYVDLNAEGMFGAASTGSTDARRLLDNTEMGAARGERLFRAMGMIWKDYEPEYAYLLTSPETLADFRAANIVDETKITDGNLQFQTLFGGKFRIILTRSSQGNSAANANVNNSSTKTTFIVRPGAINWHTIQIPVATEIDRDAKAYYGGGSTDLWYRFGYIAHPLGYDWQGANNVFPSLANYANGANWERKIDPLNLGIIPILHS